MIELTNWVTKLSTFKDWIIDELIDEIPHSLKGYSLSFEVLLSTPMVEDEFKDDMSDAMYVLNKHQDDHLMFFIHPQAYIRVMVIPNKERDAFLEDNTSLDIGECGLKYGGYEYLYRVESDKDSKHFEVKVLKALSVEKRIIYSYDKDLDLAYFKDPSIWMRQRIQPTMDKDLFSEVFARSGGLVSKELYESRYANAQDLQAIAISSLNELFSGETIPANSGVSTFLLLDRKAIYKHCYLHDTTLDDFYPWEYNDGLDTLFVHNDCYLHVVVDNDTRTPLEDWTPFSQETVDVIFKISFNSITGDYRASVVARNYEFGKPMKLFNGLKDINDIPYIKEWDKETYKTSTRTQVSKHEVDEFQNHWDKVSQAHSSKVDKTMGEDILYS